MRFSGSSVLKIGGNFKKIAIKHCMIPDTAKNTERALGSVLWSVPAAGPDPHQRVGTNAGSSSAPSPKTAPMWMRCSRKQGCPSTGPQGRLVKKRQYVRHPGPSRRTYADSLLPVAYDSFLEEAATVMQPRHHRMLRKLLDFRFDRRATRYNLPANRLKMIEQEIRRRASWLLK